MLEVTMLILFLQVSFFIFIYDICFNLKEDKKR